MNYFPTDWHKMLLLLQLCAVFSGLVVTEHGMLSFPFGGVLASFQTRETYLDPPIVFLTDVSTNDNEIPISARILRKEQFGTNWTVSVGLIIPWCHQYFNNKLGDVTVKYIVVQNPITLIRIQSNSSVLIPVQSSNEIILATVQTYEVLPVASTSWECQVDKLNSSNAWAPSCDSSLQGSIRLPWLSLTVTKKANNWYINLNKDLGTNTFLNETIAIARVSSLDVPTVTTSEVDYFAGYQNIVSGWAPSVLIRSPEAFNNKDSFIFSYLSSNLEGLQTSPRIAAIGTYSGVRIELSSSNCLATGFVGLPELTMSVAMLKFGPLTPNPSCGPSPVVDPLFVDPDVISADVKKIFLFDVSSLQNTSTALDSVREAFIFISGYNSSFMTYGSNDVIPFDLSTSGSSLSLRYSSTPSGVVFDVSSVIDAVGSFYISFQLRPEVKEFPIVKSYFTINNIGGATRNPVTGHYYKTFSGGAPFTAIVAKSECEAMRLLSSSGDLISIQIPEENIYEESFLSAENISGDWYWSDSSLPIAAGYNNLINPFPASDFIYKDTNGSNGNWLPGYSATQLQSSTCEFIPNETFSGIVTSTIVPGCMMLGITRESCNTLQLSSLFDFGGRCRWEVSSDSCVPGCPNQLSGPDCSVCQLKYTSSGSCPFQYCDSCSNGFAVPKCLIPCPCLDEGISSKINTDTECKCLCKPGYDGNYCNQTTSTTVVLNAVVSTPTVVLETTTTMTIEVATPEPAVDPTAMLNQIDVVSIAVPTSAGIGLLGGSSSATTGLLRQSLLLKVVKCTIEDNIDPDTAPIVLDVNPNWIGAGLGNITLTVAILSFHAIITLFWMKKRRISWIHARSSTRFPHHSLLGFIFLFPGMVLISSKLLFHHSGSLNKIVGVLFSSLWMSFMVLAFLKIRNLDAEYMIATGKKRVEQYLLGEGEWVSTNEKRVAQCWGLLFEQFRGGCSKFLLAELLFLFIISNLAAVESGECSTCFNLSIITSVLFLGWLCLCVKFRPWASPFDNHFNIVATLIQLTALVLDVAAFHICDASHWTAVAAEIFMLTSSLIAVAKGLLDAILMFYQFITGRRKSLQKQADVSLSPKSVAQSSEMKEYSLEELSNPERGILEIEINNHNGEAEITITEASPFPNFSFEKQPVTFAGLAVPSQSNTPLDAPLLLSPPYVDFAPVSSSKTLPTSSRCSPFAKLTSPINLS